MPVSKVQSAFGTGQPPRHPVRRDDNKIMRGARILREQILNAEKHKDMQNIHSQSSDNNWSDAPDAVASGSSSSDEDYGRRRRGRANKPVTMRDDRKGDKPFSLKDKVSTSPAPTMTMAKSYVLTDPPPPPPSAPPRPRQSHRMGSSRMTCNVANVLDSDDVSSYMHPGEAEQWVVRNRGSSTKGRATTAGPSIAPVAVKGEVQREASNLTYGVVGWQQLCAKLLSPLSSEQRRLPFDIPSPLSADYAKLLDDPAFQHALNAGQCWQSLVGQIVRFPSQWWNGKRGPPMGHTGEEPAVWEFYGRHKLKCNKVMNKLIPNRASPGILMIHIIVQDMMTMNPVQDIVVGAFHPNARKVRRSAEPDPKEEYNRDIWMAVRKREDSVSVVDNLLNVKRLVTSKSPLGEHHVSNQHIRAVFGDSPPLDTIFLPEGILYERLLRSMETSIRLSPAEAILMEFVF